MGGGLRVSFSLLASKRGVRGEGVVGWLVSQLNVFFFRKAKYGTG